jgi:hypothetical protein
VTGGVTNVDSITACPLPEDTLRARNLITTLFYV